MSQTTRRQKRGTLRAGCAGGAILAGLLFYVGVWVAAPAYIAVILGIRLFSWPTVCGAFRTPPAAYETCRALVTGKLAGCENHRLDKARDLSAVLNPRHPGSPVQVALRLFLRRSAEPIPVLTATPFRVTFKNAFSIYGLIICVVIIVAGGAIYILAR